MKIKKAKGKIDCVECGNEKEGYIISQTYNSSSAPLCSDCIVTLSNSLTEIISEIRFEKDLKRFDGD